LLSLVAPELVRIWADKNPLKNKISGPLEKIIRNGFLPEPEENYSSLLGSAENIGKLITIAARTLTKVHESNPDFLARTFEPGFKKFIEGIDFGELRDLMDGSADDIAALVKMANDVAWLYPAKLVLTLSFIPDIVNGMLLIVKESVSRFNQTSPDIVADIVLSLVRKIDGRSAGKCFNELIELIRSIHTGSALIGDPGTPKFLQDISKLFQDAAEFVDGEVLAKARVALAEDREAISNATIDVLKENPDLWLKQLMRYADIINPGIRSKSYRMSALEELPEEDLTAAVDNGISDLDMQEAAEVMNLFSTLFNRVHSLKPAILEKLATQFVNALDLYELKDAAGRMMTDLGESFRPAGRAILPHLIKAVCGIMEPADDEYEDDMAEVREMLRTVLAGEEASS